MTGGKITGSRIRRCLKASGLISTLLVCLLLSAQGASAMWPSPQKVSTGSSTGNQNPQFAIDAAGHPHVVWQGNDGSTDQIYYAENTGSGWTPQLVSTIDLTANQYPQIALDAAGHPNIVWSGNDGSTSQIYYAENTGGGWTPQLVSTGGTLTSNRSPQIALDAAGHPNVVWQGNNGSDRVYYAENTGSGWIPQLLPGALASDKDPRIALDAAGNPNVAWLGYDGAYDYAYFAKNTGSGWTPEVVSNGQYGDLDYVRLALDAAGNPRVVWRFALTSSQVYYADKTTGTWVPEQVSLSGNLNQNPEIAVDPEGNPSVVWRGSSSEIFLAEKTGSAWPQQQVSSSATSNNYPRIAIDAAGNPGVAWRYGPSNTWIYYAKNTGSGWSPVEVSSGTSNNDEQQIVLDADGYAHIVWSGNDGSTGQVYYSQFTVAPTLTTNAAAAVTQTSATLNGNMTATGGQDADWRGFRWRKSGDSEWTTWKQSGQFGAGAFSHPVSGLSPGTSYEFQAQAHNVAGAASGDTTTFTTVSPLSAWYLAEGTTAWGFNTRITIENPNAGVLSARVTFMPKGGSNVTESVTLPANSQTTLTNDHLVSKLGQRDFSTKVEATDASKAIAVDRTMEWTGQGASAPEGHSSIGVTSPASTWYLPEGSTNWGFECWLLIQNPGSIEAACDVTYMVEDKGPQTVNHKVPAHSRESYSMAADIGAADASIKVVSDQPVIPERAMYRNNRREGHDSIGTTTPANDFYLAEGAVGYDSGYTTYVLVQNPQNATNNITITYLTGSGQVKGPSFTMQPNSRKTVKVNDSLPANTDVSTSVHGSKPIIAERAMYWSSSAGEACHDSVGMSRPSGVFYFPDGQTSTGRETWTLVQNPNGEPVEVRVSYLPAGGGTPVTFTDMISANSRKTYNMADKLPSGRASIMVQGITKGYAPVMCERAMYWDSRCAGTDTIGGAE